MSYLKRLIIIFLKKSEDLSAFSCHLTKITRKSSFSTHPKHLVQRKYWYSRWLKRNFRVLDVGCGKGEHSFRMAKECQTVIAFDLDERALNQAKKRKKQEKIKNIKFFKIDANKKLAFKNNVFDLILCQDVLEHVKNYKKTTKELIRILKNKGLFLVTLPNKETSWKRLKKQAGQFWFADKGHIKEWSLREIENFPREFGLKLVEKQMVVYDTPFTGFIDLVGGISLFLYQKLLVWKRNKVIKNPEESTGLSLVLKKT